jgi:hypothetical protein
MSLTARVAEARAVSGSALQPSGLRRKPGFIDWRAVSMRFYVRLAPVVALLLLARSSLAHEFQYSAVLSGPAESPLSASPATGNVLITLDLDIIAMRVQASFSGLTGNVTSAHVQGLTPAPFTGTAGVASLDPTLPSFPLGVTSGTYDQTIDLGTASGYSSSFITASGGTVGEALNALVFGMADGRTYFELDTTSMPGGEIRGFLTAVPEPSALSLLGGVGVLALRRHRRI